MLTLGRFVAPSALTVTICVSACTVRSGTDITDSGAAFILDSRAVEQIDSGDLVSTVRPDTGPRQDTGPVGPAIDDVLIYAHSSDTLYEFSAYSSMVREIGVFRETEGGMAILMLDLAVNEAGTIYTTSNTGLYRVDPTTARVTLIGELSFPVAEERLYALTFIQPGELRNEEVLVGATNEGVYYEVNPTTAAATRLGQYPDGWLSSGDLVSVRGFGTYATLKRPRMPNADDMLARITFSPDGSSRVEEIGIITGAAGIFGLGFWGSSLYGFVKDGRLLRIDPSTAQPVEAIKNTGTDQFWGAGVTIDAALY